MNASAQIFPNCIQPQRLDELPCSREACASAEILMIKTAFVVALLAGAVSSQQSILETAKKDGRFKTLVTALGKSNAIKTLAGKGPFTVFAPTDEAFAKLDQKVVGDLLKKRNQATLDNILTYHVAAGDYRAADVVTRSGLAMANGQRLAINVHGKTVRVDRAQLVITDVACTNGVIHVIDSVLMPETRALPEIANGRYFGTLLAAVKAAGLLETLAGNGPFTILAPTDQAFAKLPKGTVANLLKPANRGKLQAILKYHVIAGRVSSSQAIAAGRAKTLLGQSIDFEVVDGRLRVRGANVTKTDVNAANGVVHVIDSVLIPPTPPRPAGRLVIGVTFDTPSAALATQLGIDRHASLVIKTVSQGSGAELAGLQRYDVITKVAGAKASSKAVENAKQQAGYGGELTLELIRGGKHIIVPVAVGVAGE